MKSQGSVGGFELVDETVLEASELLINENSVNLQEPIGEFFSQAIIDDNWVISSSNTSINEFTASRETSNLNNAVFLSGSFRNHSGSVTFTPQQDINFATKGDYELTFKSFVDTDTNSVDDDHKVDVYLTGSSFFSSSGYLEPYGLKIAELESSGSKYFGKVDIDFTTSETGNGNILFHVKRGLWRFSDISIRSVRESGFSPATTTLYIPIPDNQKDDVLDFEFKFYDNDNNEASASFQKLDNDFEGGNTFIGGGSNLVTGSVFVGSSTGSGMEFAGVQSAFLRSVGYEGYTSASSGTGPSGFLLFSGSVLTDTTDDYDNGGVGFEFHGGSGSAGESSFGARDGRTNAIRFHTYTGVLEVTGSIVAEDGEIGGWTIDSTKIAKNGVELNSAESGLRVVNPAGREVVYVGSRSLQEVSGSGVTSSFNGSFEIANVPAVQGSGIIISQSNQISGWNIQYTGSVGAAKIESGTTYPSASVIAVDESNVLLIVNPEGVTA